MLANAQPPDVLHVIVPTVVVTPEDIFRMLKVFDAVAFPLERFEPVEPAKFAGKVTGNGNAPSK